MPKSPNKHQQAQAARAKAKAAAERLKQAQHADVEERKEDEVIAAGSSSVAAAPEDTSVDPKALSFDTERNKEEVVSLDGSSASVASEDSNVDAQAQNSGAEESKEEEGVGLGSFSVSPEASSEFDAPASSSSGFIDSSFVVVSPQTTQLSASLSEFEPLPSSSVVATEAFEERKEYDLIAETQSHALSYAEAYHELECLKEEIELDGPSSPDAEELQDQAKELENILSERGILVMQNIETAEDYEDPTRLMEKFPVVSSKCGFDQETHSIIEKLFEKRVNEILTQKEQEAAIRAGISRRASDQAVPRLLVHSQIAKRIAEGTVTAADGAYVNSHPDHPKHVAAEVLKHLKF